MPIAPKTGPLTFDELLALWKSGTDTAYSEPLLRSADGAAVVGQMLAQLAFVSRAIDETFQTLFLLPGSGQTGEPASGPVRSRVVLTISRSSGFEIPLAFLPGTLRVEEVAGDMGPDGPIPARTGRFYASAETKVLMPGEDEIPLLTNAERAGRGYDLPRPGTIRGFAQPGALLQGENATAVRAEPLHRLIASPRPDAPAPENVGSYVLLTAGANAGRMLRVAGYEPPDEAATNGGTLLLAATGLFVLSLLSGTFRPGEKVEQFPSGAKGVFLAADGDRMLLDRTSGIFQTTQVVIGQENGAQAVFSDVEIDPEIVDETTTAGWRILAWDVDLGLACSNALSPAGGRNAMLDEIGHERKIFRGANERTEAFRPRVAEMADTIAPNAIQRTVNRVLTPSNREGLVREVGQPNFRGLFYDGDPASLDPGAAFAYDLPGIDYRFHSILDYAEFRGFFIVEIPNTGEGDFGCAYDAGVSNAYDAAPWLAFYDGIAIQAAIDALDVWHAVDRARAYGVGFDLVLAGRFADIPPV